MFIIDGMNWIKKPLVIAVVFTGLAVALSAGTGAYLIYKKGLENEVTKNISKALPFPAAIVNNRPIAYAYYRERGVDFTKQFYEKTKGRDYIKSDEGKEKISAKKRELIDIILEEEFIREYARAHGIQILGSELEESYKKLVAENGGAAAFEKSLREDYRWSTKFFKSILKVNLLRQKIEESLCGIESEPAKAVAADVKQQLDKGSTFADLAGKYSEDPATAASAGRLPAFSPDGLTEEGNIVDEAIVDFANRAKVGETEAVKTCRGYAIVRLDDKSETELAVSQILIKIQSYEDLLFEFREKSNIHVLLPDFYFAKNEKAVFPR